MKNSSLYKPVKVRTRDLFRPIDKLNLFLGESHPLEDITLHLKQVHIMCQIVRLKDNKDALEVGGPYSGVFFRLIPKWDRNRRTSHLTRQLVTRPSAFESWSVYEDFIHKITPFNLWNKQVIRLDYSLDIHKKFPEMVQQLQVGYKQTSDRHSSKSSQLTGIYFGKESRLLAYGKGVDENLEYSNTDDSSLEEISRLEFQKYRLSSGACKFLYSDVQDHFRSIINDETPSPFRYVTFRENHIPKNQFNDFELAKILTLLEHLGFTYTKKVLNKDRNFEKKYGYFFPEVKEEERPAFLYKQSLKSFFDPLTEVGHG